MPEKPVVISNASSLMNLAIISKLKLLKEFYDKIKVPNAVWREVVLQGKGQKGTEEIEKVKELEEVKRMPYVTSFERIGMRKGVQQGYEEMVLEALDERFGGIPDDVSETVSKIEDRDTLKSLHRYAIRCASLEEFKKSLNGK